MNQVHAPVGWRYWGLPIFWSSLLVRTEPFVLLTEMAGPDDYRHVLDEDESICDLYSDEEHDVAMKPRT